MKQNLGTIDKSIRILIATAFIIMYFTGVISGTIGIVLIIFSVIFVLTSLAGTCPLYLPLGLSTLRKKISK